MAALVMFGTAAMLLALEHSPVQYYLYFVMPLFFWSYVIDNRHVCV